jgi:hypothetical protein
MKEKTGLRWHTGVPVATNPLILVDIGSLLVLLWGGTVLFITGLQLVIGDSLQGSHVQGAAVFATYLALFTAAVFLFIAVVFFQNRYVVLYRLDDEKAWCETIKKTPSSLAESLHCLPFPVPSPVPPFRSVVKSVPWDGIGKAVPLADVRTILLKRGRGTAMRIYCPDDAVFGEALRFINEMTAAGGKGLKSGDGR